MRTSVCSRLRAVKKNELEDMVYVVRNQNALATQLLNAFTRDTR